MPNPSVNYSSPSFFVYRLGIARIFFYLASSLLLMAADRYWHFANDVRAQGMILLYPFEIIAEAPLAAYESLRKQLRSHQELLADNQILKTQLLKQQVQLQSLYSVLQENDYLRRLWNAEPRVAVSKQLAEIVHLTHDPYSQKVVINRGGGHQVSAGEAVVDAAGVLGQVTRVYPHTSEVTLITDRSLSVPVLVERNGLRAIAFGRGQDNALDLPYLPANADIKLGDRLMTSGIDGVYPQGIMVATITSIRVASKSSFAQITCTPAGAIAHHKQVLLIRATPHKQPAQQYESPDEI